VPAPAVIRKA